MEDQSVMQNEGETARTPDLSDHGADEVMRKEEAQTTQEETAELLPPVIPSEDRAELAKLFTEEDVSTVTEEDTVRYLALRTLGLSPKEAYLAANGDKTLARIDAKRRALARLFSEQSASKAHVTSAALGAAATASAMPRDALLEARALFSGMSDKEIERLYNRAKGAQ